MPRLSEMLLKARLRERPMVLIASLPRNDPELAQAALDGGADVIKVHINLNHRASQTHFANLAQEIGPLEKILRISRGRPCGIVPGAGLQHNPQELDELPRLGFSFLSLYLRDAPVGQLPPAEKIERMLALAFEDPPETASALDGLPLQVCEMSIMAKETYGQPLSFQDLARYRAVRQQTSLPLVAPTQHYFTPAALDALNRIGVEGVMLGAIVAGATPDSWNETMRAFRAEADRLYQAQ